MYLFHTDFLLAIYSDSNHVSTLSETETSKNVCANSYIIARNAPQNMQKDK